MDEIGRIERRIGLHDLRVLMAVVKAGSMGKAARLLATSQSAISRSIGELEQTLGVRLLDRSANGIEPTSYGQALCEARNCGLRRDPARHQGYPVYFRSNRW